MTSGLKTRSRAKSAEHAEKKRGAPPSRGGMIGVGRDDWFRLPLPPNRTGGSPASGSPVEESPRKGLADSRMGMHQGKQPLCCKEPTGPSLMVEAKAPTAFAESMTENAA